MLRIGRRLEFTLLPAAQPELFAQSLCAVNPDSHAVPVQVFLQALGTKALTRAMPVLVESYFFPVVSYCSSASKHGKEQTASLQTALLPEAHQAGHDASLP